MLTVYTNELVMVTRKVGRIRGTIYFFYTHNMEVGNCKRTMKYDNILYLLCSVPENTEKGVYFVFICCFFNGNIMPRTGTLA